MSVNGPRLVGVGASAGGVEALLEVMAGLEPAMPAAVLVVVHQAGGAPTVLADILGRECALRVRGARHGQQLVAGEVVVGPPDAHLGVLDGRVVLHDAVPGSGPRPGVDTLLRSLTGDDAVGVILSGMLDDGAAGLAELVRAGGAAVVQDPREALHPSMPDAALARVPGSLVRRARDIGPTLARLVGTRGRDDGDGTDRSDDR